MYDIRRAPETGSKATTGDGTVPRRIKQGYNVSRERDERSGKQRSEDEHTIVGRYPRRPDGGTRKTGRTEGMVRDRSVRRFSLREDDGNFLNLRSRSGRPRGQRDSRSIAGTDELLAEILPPTSLLCESKFPLNPAKGTAAVTGLTGTGPKAHQVLHRTRECLGDLQGKGQGAIIRPEGQGPGYLHRTRVGTARSAKCQG
ncbi:hypothetical protein NUW54_g9265 [Trametes sanguinea]|uniref:Uncharacterized protein n=1 Tax=Trametes sanguinea TaxID=158606 RepID=A0ACC1PA22_9APHY|nr:hypothetical protein NUW54_g9265 [Trametes sanguinea]